MRKTALHQPVARDGKHLRTHVYADGTLRLGAKQFEHPACARAGIEEIFDWSVCKQARNRRLTSLSGALKRTDAVPIPRHWL
ncbi:MAG: hypothetical protein WDM89_05555 [Rhizomicrobium sp.]